MTIDFASAPERVFDYVIVGAGSAGCVLAGRLAASGVGSVAVVEAGKRRWPKITAIPAAVVRTIGHPHYDWMYMSEPDPTRDNRSEGWPRGKGPGGSSLINGMIFVRGNPADYDAWERAGATGWSYADVLPYFMRLEDSEYEGQGRGGLGPQKVSRLRYIFSLTAPFIEAARHVGIPHNPDINGPVQTGIGDVQVAQRNGRRDSSFDAFLAPAVRNGSATLIDGAQVHRIMVDGGRASGIAVMRNGKAERIMAHRQVILAVGAINTPHLLMLSGIGPAEMLRAHGIDVIKDAPEVGRNLMEHVGIWMRTQVDTPTLNQEGSLWRTALALARWIGGKGPATASTAQAVGFVDTTGQDGPPDLQIHLCPMSIARGPKGATLPRQKLMGVVASVNRPKSKGHIGLRSSSPTDAPEIRPMLLERDEDRDILKRGVRLCERILSADPIARHVVAIQNAPPPQGDDAAMEAYLRSFAAPLYHPVGTCRMGSDSGSVVDPHLNVRGVDGLMVVDASIMPTHVSGNTHAAAMMIGEKAADMLLRAA